MRLVIVLSVTLVLCAIPTGVLKAQLIQPSQSVSINLDPPYPHPNETIKASVTGSGVTIINSRISWYVDGKRIQKNLNDTLFEFTAPALGEKRQVTVVVQPINGSSVTASETVRPTQVVIIWEGDTYTPPFYKGRSLYTTGSRVRLEAHAMFRTQSGTVIDPNALIYIWKRNGIIISKSSGVGKTSLAIQGPAFLGSDIIEVFVSSKDNIYAGTSAIRITTADPLLQLYQTDPLTGVHYYKIIDTDTVIPQTTQLRIQAEPYFMDIQAPSDTNIDYTWNVNGVSVLPIADNPSILSLQFSTTHKVKTTISLAVTHAKHLLQKADGIFNISFNGSFNNSFLGF